MWKKSIWLLNNAMLQEINNLDAWTAVTNRVPAKSAAEKPRMLRYCNMTSHKIACECADKSNWSGSADTAVLPRVFTGAINCHGRISEDR
jgi:hypothetical protein